MANKKTKVSGIVFEGVSIPKGTRSAKLGAKEIKSTAQMGEFLTAVFAETLSGKITLPPPESPNRVSPKLLKGLEKQLRLGSHITLQPSQKKVKVKPPKQKTLSQVNQHYPTPSQKKSR
jgi:hypothetical protein